MLHPVYGMRESGIHTEYQADWTRKAVTEFLLVPWVGACIHTPPPPPNQIVHVTTAEPFVARSRFEPVTIQGTMKITRSTPVSWHRATKASSSGDEKNCCT